MLCGTVAHTRDSAVVFAAVIMISLYHLASKIDNFQTCRNFFLTRFKCNTELFKKQKTVNFLVQFSVKMIILMFQRFSGTYANKEFLNYESQSES